MEINYIQNLNFLSENFREFPSKILCWLTFLMLGVRLVWRTTSPVVGLILQVGSVQLLAPHTAQRPLLYTHQPSVNYQ